MPRFLHENPAISILWTPRDTYRVTVSVYTPSARSESVPPVRAHVMVLLLASASNEAESAALQKQINGIDQV